MTNPPLDLPAKLTTEREVAELVAKLHAAEDERDKAQRACQTLGRIIDRQCEDALTATDSQDLLWGDDGDGDWGAIWERVLGLGEKAREATTRAEAAENKIAAVEALHTKDDRECAICRDAYGDYVHYPCPTITALDTHTPETETTP